MRNVALPVTLIVVGVLGVVWYYGWFPNIESVTALALVAAGVVILITDRITKHSIVLGPMLIAVGACVWLHDAYRLRWWLLVSILLILLGVLMLVARGPRIPEHRMRPSEPPPPPAPPSAPPPPPSPPDASAD
jgi:hypothetical protein